MLIGVTLSLLGHNVSAVVTIVSSAALMGLSLYLEARDADALQDLRAEMLNGLQYLRTDIDQIKDKLTAMSLRNQR